MPQLKLMPTGGVTLDNAGDWIRAGAVAVGVGSALLDGRRSTRGVSTSSIANARRIVASVASARPAIMNAAASRVVTFGEIMLRLGSPGFERLLQSAMLTATFGGGEANVAVSLAQFGLASDYVTRLPNNALGDAVDSRAACRRGWHLVHRRAAEAVSVSTSPKPGRVSVHPRWSTIAPIRPISEIPPDAVKWDEVMEGAAWFHVTGITPALGENDGRGDQGVDRGARRRRAPASASI